MAHTVVGLIVLILCTWAVFSPHVHDGFIGRHLLVFAAISAAGFAYGGELQAFLTMYALVLTFLILYYAREFKKICHAKMD